MSASPEDVQENMVGSWEMTALVMVRSSIAVGILRLVLRTVSFFLVCKQMIRGAVEKTLKGILTICTVLVFPVVVALSWTIYNGVKSFHYGGSVAPAMPSASSIRVFIHDEAQGGCSTRVKVLSMDWYASCYFRKESYTNVALSSGTICSWRFLSA